MLNKPPTKDFKKSPEPFLFLCLVFWLAGVWLVWLSYFVRGCWWCLFLWPGVVLVGGLVVWCVFIRVLEVFDG